MSETQLPAPLETALRSMRIGLMSFGGLVMAGASDDGDKSDARALEDTLRAEIAKLVAERDEAVAARQQSAAGQAVRHVLGRIVSDPEIAWYFDPLTESYRLLVEAYAE